MIISGWGMLQYDNSKVVIDTNLRIKSSTLTLFTRPDVVTAMNDPRLANAGIKIRLDLDGSPPPMEQIKFCVWTVDPELGRHLLTISTPPGSTPPTCSTD